MSTLNAHDYTVGEILTAATLDGATADDATLNTDKLEMKTGTHTGDGNASQGITGLVITPKYLRLWEKLDNDADTPVMWETTDGLVDNNVAGLCYVINAAGNSSVQTDAIVSLESDGYTVGLGGGSPNANGKVVEYMAIGS